MIEKEVTFESEYGQRDTQAIQWLLDLAKCFTIRSASLKTYIVETKYTKKYRCKLKVRFD